MSVSEQPFYNFDLEQKSDEWRTVPGFDNYLCSRTGFVKNKKTGRILKPADDSDGYPKVTLTNSLKKKHCIAVHRVVATTYLWNKDKPQVNHKDGNKHNNCVENLEWVTNKENIAHAIRTGLLKVKGSDNANAKINSRTAKHIRELFVSGKWNKCQLGRMFGISRTMVRYIVEGKNWR